ncbi:MAG: hypothetical protein U0R51_03050 [Solirubrobacterales bacterium]
MLSRRVSNARLGSYRRGARNPYVPAQRGWRMWWMKRRWYDRTHRLRHRWPDRRHAANGGFYVRHPIEGEVLEALDDGRPHDRRGHDARGRHHGSALAAGSDRPQRFLNRETMLAAQESIEIGDHVMFANHCFVGDADAASTTPSCRSPGRASFPRAGSDRLQQLAREGRRRHRGTEIGEHCVIGSNSVVTRDTPPWTISAGAPAKVLREIEPVLRTAGLSGREATQDHDRTRSHAIAPIAAGCGEKEEPPTTGPVVTQTTTGQTSTTQTTTGRSGPTRS